MKLDRLSVPLSNIKCYKSFVEIVSIIGILNRIESCGIDELCFDLLCPRALIQSAITFWMNQGAIICVSKSPLKYRRVRFFTEQGIVLDTQDENAMSVLERMRVYERFVTDVLNTCTNFDIHQLQRRLTVFLQGVNRCRIKK